MFRTLKLIRYVTNMDYFVLACEGIFVLFLLYYSIEEIIEIKKHKLQYFKSFWNILDIVVILMGVVCVVFNLYRTMEVSALLKNLLSNKDQYANFEVLGFWQEQFNSLVAIAVFCAWIKVSCFPYLNWNNFTVTTKVEFQFILSDKFACIVSLECLICNLMTLFRCINICIYGGYYCDRVATRTDMYFNVLLVLI